MRDHHTSQHLHVSLAGTDTEDCHWEQSPQETCFSAISNEIFQNLPNVFGIVDDILVVGYYTDEKDHDEML